MFCLVRILLLTVVTLAAFPPCLAGEPSPLKVGTDKQLLFDDRFIAESDNVEIVRNQPKKLGPVLKPDRRWEDFRYSSYFTVLQKDGLCRMYYSCFSEDQWNYAEPEVTWRDYAFLC